jgi:hypothetical protein
VKSRNVSILRTKWRIHTGSTTPHGDWRSGSAVLVDKVYESRIKWPVVAKLVRAMVGHWQKFKTAHLYEAETGTTHSNGSRQNGRWQCARIISTYADTLSDDHSLCAGFQAALRSLSAFDYVHPLQSIASSVETYNLLSLAIANPRVRSHIYSTHIYCTMPIVSMYCMEIRMSGPLTRTLTWTDLDPSFLWVSHSKRPASFRRRVLHLIINNTQLSLFSPKSSAITRIQRYQVHRLRRCTGV